MSKMIQIRNVPDRLHRVLKSRAASAGMTLSDFVKKDLERMAALPTMEEWLDQVSRNRPIPSGLSAAEIIRELRDSR